MSPVPPRRYRHRRPSLAILLVILVALLVARLGSRALRRILQRIADRAAERSGSPRPGHACRRSRAVAANVWRFLVFVIAVAICLGIVGINLAPLLASATIIGATLGFGAQLIMRDYFSGFLLTLEDQYGIGDSITVGTVSGVVEDLTLRVTGCGPWTDRLHHCQRRHPPTRQLRVAGPRPWSTSPSPGHRPPISRRAATIEGRLGVLPHYPGSPVARRSLRNWSL